MPSTYDNRNRLIATTNPLGQTTTRLYDAAGNLLAQADANNNTTSYTYDQVNRVVTVTNAKGYQTNYAYDAAGNRTSLTDANGNTTTFAYNNRNRLMSITDPLGKQTDFEYDAVANLIKKTTPNLRPCGCILYTYNATGQVWEVFYPKRNRFVYAYDKNGARTKMRDRHTDVDYTYDALGHVVQMIDNKLNKQISYSYDAVGNRTQMTDPEGATVTYTYDAAKRLDTVKRNAILQADYDYDAAGRRVKLTLGNGSYSEYTPACRQAGTTPPRGLRSLRTRNQTPRSYQASPIRWTTSAIARARPTPTATTLTTPTMSYTD